MNKGALIAAIVAAVLGVALLTVYKNRFEAETSGGPKVLILVANRDIPYGEVLRKQMLSPRGLPVAYLEDRHIRVSDLRQVIGVRVSRSIRANESVLWSDLAVSTKIGRTLADMIRPGMRALAVPASLPSTFNGLLRPGDRIDVLLTTGHRTSRNRVTIPLLQNVLVLAIGSDVGNRYGAPMKNDPNGAQFRLTTVTMAVSMRQTELLTLAQAEGLITVALRHPSDVELIDGLPEADRRDLLNESRRRLLQQRRPPTRKKSTTRSSKPPRENDLEVIRDE